MTENRSFFLGIVVGISIAALVAWLTQLSTDTKFVLVPRRTTDPLAKLFDVMWQVESGGRGYDAVGDDGKSIGPYQISKNYWLDSNVPSTWSDCLDRTYSEKVMLAYWQRWVPDALKDANFEVLARTHNGGPRGQYKESTLQYWHKVKVRLK